MKFLLNLIACSMLLANAIPASAEPELYETGPSEESAYIRFVNATEQSIALTSANGAKIVLPTQSDKRVSRFYRVKAGSKLSSTIHQGNHKTAVNVSGKAWEYITIAVISDGSDIKTELVRETPEDFSAMRASLALFNLDPRCNNATMRGGPKNVSIFDGLAPFAVQRRLINPVKLTANISCDGKPANTQIDIPQMQAGERYSVFLFAPKARAAFIATDSN